MAHKRSYATAKTKISILKSYLKGKSPISELAEKYHVEPRNVYTWENRLWSEGEIIFERANDRNSGKGAAKRYQEKIAALEAKLAQKNEVIAELLEEHVKLKKENGGI